MFSTEAVRRFFLRKKNSVCCSPGWKGQNIFSLWEKIYFIPSIENDRPSEGGIIFFWAPEKKAKIILLPSPTGKKFLHYKWFFFGRGEFYFCRKNERSIVSPTIWQRSLFSKGRAEFFLRKKKFRFSFPGGGEGGAKFLFTRVREWFSFFVRARKQYEWRKMIPSRKNKIILFCSGARGTVFFVFS